MRTFTFTDEKEINVTKEHMSYKKAVKSFQISHEIPTVKIKYTNKKGTIVDRWIKLPIGRKKKIGKQSKVTLKSLINQEKRFIVRLRMWYAKIRGHKGMRWNYEPSEHYMGWHKHDKHR